MLETNIHCLQLECHLFDVAYDKLHVEHQDIFMQDTDKNYPIILAICVIFCKFHSKPLDILLEDRDRYWLQISFLQLYATFSNCQGEHLDIRMQEINKRYFLESHAQ
jgi:hypothetical protein